MVTTQKSGDNIAYFIEEDSEEVLSYWTREREEKAISVLPQAKADTGSDRDWHKIVEITEPSEANLGKMPFSAGGKLFYRCNEVDYVASGEIFMWNNLLLTAAHCVQDSTTGNLYDHFKFKRCFNDGSRVEELTFKTIAIKIYWQTDPEWRWDYAIAILNKSSCAPTPLRYTTKDADLKEITLFGYPTNYYDGKKMVYEIGTTDRRTMYWTRNIFGNKMGAGSSGGAWVLADNQTVVGLNSHSLSEPGYSYMGSPVLDKNFDYLYEFVLSLM